ncbi:MAG TPA: flavodoxin domain-containing protein [Candidatus Dojkabacteria bacterium]|nr:flavodoxin domain-containing protein [Candidatus Dojkabacteria bacterium]
MKALVLYDSFFGNTKLVAEIIAKELDCKAVKVDEFNPDMLQGLQLLVVGSPIRGWRPSPLTHEFLNALPQGSLKGIKAASFDTRMRIFIHGDATKQISSGLINAGAEILVDPKWFDVKTKEGPLFEEEQENAKTRAQQLISKLKGN